MTGGSRTDVLASIRSAAGPSATERAADYAAIDRGYVQAGALDEAGRLTLFVERLEHYQVGVRVAGRERVAAAVGDVLRARGKRGLVIPATFPEEWLPGGFDFTPDLDLSYDSLDRAEGVLTSCSVAIAMTGSIVLRHEAGEGRRAASLIPDYHLCIVQAEQVVETVPEGMRRLRKYAPSLVTTIAGPSATADIEMTRVRGVHGPRTLDVVLVAEALAGR